MAWKSMNESGCITALEPIRGDPLGISLRSLALKTGVAGLS